MLSWLARVTLSLPRRDPTDDLVLEEVAARAWCLEQVRAGPWLLRASGGHTRLANAVAVLDGGGDDTGAPLAERIAQAEAFYAERHLPARFQLADGDRHAALAGTLERRGYRREEGGDSTWWRAPLRSLRSVAPAERDGRVLIADAPSQGWVDLWWETLGAPESEKEAATELLWDLRGRCGFAAHVTNGEMVGVGLGMIEGPWLGVYALGVREDRRARGSGRRIVCALATWGTAHAAQTAYVPLEDGAAACVGLIGQLRFTPGSRFHFLRRDLA